MNAILGLFNLGGGEIVLIFAVVLLLFGAKKLPELAKGLGLGIKEFKKATRDVTSEMHNAMEETPEPPMRRTPPAVVEREPHLQQAAIPERVEHTTPTPTQKS